MVFLKEEQMLNLPTEYREGDVPQKGVDLDTIQARSSARRALIIDDDPDTVDLIKIIFRNAGRKRVWHIIY